MQGSLCTTPAPDAGSLLVPPFCRGEEGGVGVRRNGREGGKEEREEGGEQLIDLHDPDCNLRFSYMHITSF